MVLARRCFRCERRFDALGMGQFKCAIDLVGGNVVEALAFVLLGQRFPVEFRGLQQAQSAHHVGLGKRKRVFDGTVHVRFGCEVDDAIDFLVLHQLIERLEVADVHFHELVVGLRLDVFEVRQIACVGQFVEVDDVVLGILVHEKAHHVASNEACAAGNDNRFHILRF